ncbi:MAG: RHS repeat domain-containing protein, partial [Pirellulaceae bacterium]
YDAWGRLCEIIDAREHPIELAYDEQGNLVSLRRVAPAGPLAGRLLLAYEYNEAGCLIRVTDVYHTTQTFEWDAAHRVTRRTDRRGYSFHFRHDAEGRCTHSRGDDGMFEVFLDYHPAAKISFVRRADGGQWIYRYNDQQVVTEVIDPLGHSTSFVLDDQGRPIQEIDPNGQVTELHYGVWGQLDYRIDPLGYRRSPSRPQPEDPLSYELPETPLEWEFGQLLDAPSIRRPDHIEPLLEPFPAPVINSVIGRTTSYDGSRASDASESDDLAEAPDDEPSTWDEAVEFGRAPEWRERTYGERWRFDPNGNEIEYRDRDGAVYRAVFDSWNARRQQINPLGETVTFQHNAQGLVTQVRDAGGAVTEYGYDLCDRLVEVRRQGRMRERYVRDGAGTLVRKEDAQGRILVTWDIGAGNQFRARHLASGETHTFERDERGRVVSMTTPAGTVTFTYDGQGRRLSDQRDGLGITHRFHRDGLVASVYLKRFEVKYHRADDGDWIVTDPEGGRHRFQVSATGLICKTLARGDRELMQYDSTGRCRRKVVWRPSPTESLWMRHFRYSPAGDLISVADNHQGETRYAYDAAHRLREELLPDGTPRRFSYDPAGNLLAQPGLREVAVDAANRLRSASGESFAYNSRDHLSSRTAPQSVTRYEYNELDLLVRCQLNDEPWTARYDGFCRRVAKTWRGQTTTYYWDDFRLAAERFPDGSLRIYVYAEDTALVPFLFVDYASGEADPSAGRSYYLFTNPIGVPVRVEDAEGRCCWSAVIDPYGHARVDPASTLNLSLRFPGHWYDDETGLHYNRFRYYSPDLGRYLQSDPLGIPGGINLYAYPANPLTAVDLDGLAKRGGTRTPKPRAPKASKSKANNASEGASDGASCPLATQGGAPKPPDPGWEINEQNVRQRMQQLGVPPDKHGHTGEDGTKQPA